MVCGKTEEDNTADDGEEWKAAVMESTLLPAAELFYMAHPDKRIPWRQLLSEFHLPRSLKPPPSRWGGRRPRSRIVMSKEVVPAVEAPGRDARKEEEVEKSGRRASPATPLSWSGGSASSGSGNEAVEAGTGAKRQRIVGSAVEGAGGCGFAGVGGDGSIKVATAAAGVVDVAEARENKVLVGRLEVTVPSPKRTRKKMTAAALNEQIKSLSQENMQLKMEIERTKMDKRMQVEEHLRLTRILETQLLRKQGVKSSLSCAAPPATEPNPEKQCFLPDLNESYCEGLEDEPLN